MYTLCGDSLDEVVFQVCGDCILSAVASHIPSLSKLNFTDFHFTSCKKCDVIHLAVIYSNIFHII